LEHKLSLNNSEFIKFETGKKIRIRSREQIRKTLDENNKPHGCYFIEDINKYCGTKNKILKKIDNIYDESNRITRKTSNTFLIDRLS
jgi:hypothetical protein